MKETKNRMILDPVAVIYTDFKEKFGIPRQSRLTKAEGLIVFEERYRIPEILRGIEDYSHLWLLWGFSLNRDVEFSPTVRPPRLGGNKRVGVFATRSPYRPNPVGLSCVKLIEVVKTRHAGCALLVQGVDMADGTPVYDIKPYVSFSDAVPDAVCGFADEVKGDLLSVCIPPELETRIPEEKREVLYQLLKGDPRPSYQEDPERIYGMHFADMEIRFQVRDDVLTVVEVQVEPSRKLW